MSLQIDQDKLIGINGKEIDHLWSSPKCSQQQRGRNGTLIINLGGTKLCNDNSEERLRCGIPAQQVQVLICAITRCTAPFSCSK